jgi:hypothetical protein
MAEHIGRPDILQHLGEVSGHVLVALARRPGALPVVAHVHGDHLPHVREPLGDHAPVPRGSEEPVDDQQRRFGGRRAMRDGVQHGSSVDLRRDGGKGACQAWRNWDIAAKARRLEELLDRGFGTGEKGLRHALRKAGRRLPRRMRRAGGVVADADYMAGHPKLFWQIDRKRVAREAEILEDYLKSVNPNKRRVDLLLSILRSPCGQLPDPRASDLCAGPLARLDRSQSPGRQAPRKTTRTVAKLTKKSRYQEPSMPRRTGSHAF